MFHAELFTSSIASGANTFAQVSYLTTDNVLPPLNKGLQVSPSLPNLMMVAGVGANLVHVRAQTTSMLPFPYPTLDPNNRGTAFESPPRIHDFSKNPIPMKGTDEFDIFATQNHGSAETEYVMAQFCDGPPQPLPVQVLPPALPGSPMMPGRFFNAHWTAAVTLTAGGWTQVQPVFDQTLPPGYYGLLGVRAYSATALFFRMYPAQQPLWRPGGVAVQAYDQLDPVNQRFIPNYSAESLGWGMWLSFYQNVPPQVEFFATSADTAEEGWFDMVYISTATTSPT